MNKPCARITLDLQQASTPTFVAVKKSDIGREIRITLSDGGFSYEISADCYAVLTGTKPDGNILYNHCDIEGNTIVYTVTEQTTAAAGRMKAEVKLYGADDQFVTSATFRIIIDGTVYDEGKVESKDEVSALTHLVSKAASVINNGNQMIEQGQQTIQSAETATQQATNAAKRAEEAADSINISGGKTDLLEPTEEDIPKVFIDGSAFKDMTIEKNEVEMSMEYISKTERFTAAIKIKYQGATSLYFDKKNFTIKMYTDDTYENKLKKVFKDWGVEQNKYVLKANYIDHSHARNIVCARLWDEVVSSRADYDTLPVEMRNSPKNGAVDGFPVKLYINGTYQGIYTWNIGKDDWMWGMDEDNQNHVLLCGETNTNGVYAETPCNFRALWSGVDEEHWTVEVGTNSDAVKNSLNALISCVKDTDDETFKATIGNYLDVQSAIDYYIHQYVINNGDGLARNMLLATFDGTKWICGAYDMDGTIGINGSESIVYSARPCPEEYAEQYSLLWYRIENLFTEELKARYFELRETVYRVANMINHFERFMDVIPLNLYEEDVEIHPGIPCAETNNIQQIRSSIRDRLAYCDVEFKKMGEDPDLMYRLEEETTFDGVDDYINTGLTPFSETQDFTILMDIDPSQNTAAANVIAVRDAFNITTDGNAPTSLTPYDSAYGWPFINNVIQTNGQRTKVALVFSGGIASAMYWKTENGSLTSTSSNGSFKSAITNNPLYIGSYYGSGGEPVLPWKGTVYSFEFWSRAMTAEEVAEKLA